MALPKKLIALLAVFAAIGLVTATGAFTTVSAERTATVNVAGDGSALLQIAPHSGPNGDYAGYNGNQFELDIGATGAGVNDNAETDIQSVFVITNQGTNPVNVSISDSDPDSSGSGDADKVTFYNVDQHGAALSGTGDLESGSYQLGTGDSLNVSIYIDTTGSVTDGDLIETVTIEADQTA